MSLSFLPEDIKKAVSHLNNNFLTEIRIRKGKPVMVCYRGEYYFLTGTGISSARNSAVVCDDINSVIAAATGGSIFSYTEQIKRGFITCGKGVRIGIAGEYVTQNGTVNTVANITSLNIRIPHEIKGCSAYICSNLLQNGPHSILLFSKPGMGKTTKLRDLCLFFSDEKKLNVLVFDERNEISAIDAGGSGFELGLRADVVRSGNKLTAIENAIRAMKPDVIIMDELQGESDMKAVGYAEECGISVIASSHVTNKSKLAELPFEYYVELLAIDEEPIIYDKDFNIIGGCGADDVRGSNAVRGQEKKDARI